MQSEKKTFYFTDVFSFHRENRKKTVKAHCKQKLSRQRGIEIDNASKNKPKR